MVGARGFEPPASCSRMKPSALSRKDLRAWLTAQAAEAAGTDRRSAPVGTSTRRPRLPDSTQPPAVALAPLGLQSLPRQGAFGRGRSRCRVIGFGRSPDRRGGG